jgi:hypothetical protein
MAYCPKCGKEVSEEDDYCTQCRSPLKNQVAYRRVRHRSEKVEKEEKNEKDNDEDEYGALIGGGVLVWLGTLLLLQNQGILRGNFGGYFLMGIGVILGLRGLLAFQAAGQSETGYGFFIGGGVLLLIGAGITYNIQDWWAFILIGFGLLIIYRGVSERGKNPVP